MRFRLAAYPQDPSHRRLTRAPRWTACTTTRRTTALLGARAAVVGALALSGCGGFSSDFEDPPKPAKTAPPTRSDITTAWLGPRFRTMRFHRVERHPRTGVSVYYGEPRPPDPGSGDIWRFPLTISTAPRRPQTRQRLRRSLGAGVNTKLGTRYGCRRAGDPRRVSVLTATVRIEITGVDCPDLIKASRQLRLV